MVVIVFHYVVPAAYFLDWLIGDPRWLVHPVTLMGRVITALEIRMYPDTVTRVSRKIAGLCLVLFVMAGTFLGTELVLRLFQAIHPLLGIGGAVWLISTTIAGHGLRQAALAVFSALAADDLKEGRRQVGMIVGRDSDQLSREDVIRATVETVAENTVDGVTAPLFWAFIAGAPGALAYRAVNTLDSMLGHKNNRYLEFGWVAARLDDVVNYVPARLTGLLLPVAAFLLRLNAKGCFQSILRDGRKHPSPNSGITEAGFAGAQGLQLGGPSVYNGQPSFRPYLGLDRRAFANNDILTAIRLMRTVATLFALLLWWCCL